MRSPLLSILACAVATAPAAAQARLHTFDGTAAGATYGLTVGTVGDLDHDGCDEVVVGSVADRAEVRSGCDGSVVFAPVADVALDWFGYSVSGAGDVDDDGTPDFVVGAPQTIPGLFVGAPGYARVLSGATGLELHTFLGDPTADPSGFGDQFGISVSDAGDVDGDGHADVIVGCLEDDDNGPNAGFARVFSGMDGSVLRTLYGPAGLQHFGYSVSGLGDLDGDGKDEVIVGSDRGGASVFAGADGSLLHHFPSVTPGDQLGFAVAGAGDLDGDGAPDILVGAPLDTSSGADTGRTWLHSGADFSVIDALDGDDPGDAMGWSVDGPGDVDGDGVPDVAASLRRDSDVAFKSGKLRVFSGLDRSILFEVDGDEALDDLGQFVHGAGDVNGDGLADLIAGVPGEDDAGEGAGGARVYSAGLGGDGGELSLAAGGAQSLVLVGGGANAGALHWILGTASGTAPGIPVDGLLLPLNLDPYLFFTLGSPQAGIVGGALGLLDGAGEASATVTIPPGSDPTLAGAVLHHAFVAIDLAGAPSVAFASNPLRLELVP